VIKAIETRYKGYRFRSRLEARWAVFFDALGLTWRYEPEGFDLDGLYYLPDFWVPEWDCWVEIKGPPIDLGTEPTNLILPDGDAWTKAFCLANATGKRVVVLCGDCWCDVGGVVFDRVSADEPAPFQELFTIRGDPSHFARFNGMDSPALEQMSIPGALCAILTAGKLAAGGWLWGSPPRHCIALAVADLKTSPNQCVLWQTGVAILESAASGKTRLMPSPVAWPLPADFGDGYATGPRASVGKVHDAFVAARSARFEHGETPR
jgi:hypothetical protein